MTLAHFYGMNVRNNGELPDSMVDPSFIERIDYFGTDAPMGTRLELFAETIAKLDADFGSWNTTWGNVNRFQRLSGDIDLQFDDNEPSLPIGMASGSWGALASYGARPGSDTKKIYGRSGNSFVAVVEFGDTVSAKTILAGGQSGDPSSPHFLDQAERYRDVEFKDVAYSREDVEARAVRTYSPGQ